MIEEDAEDDENEVEPERPAAGRLLGFGAAMGLYAALALAAFLSLKGNFLIFALIVIGALVVMTCTQHVRDKLDH